MTVRQLPDPVRNFVEQTIGRAMTLAETAIDVIALDSALEKAKNDLELAIRVEMILATMAWAAGTAILPSLRVTEAMIAPLDELFNFGRQEAALELERLGYRGVKHPPAVDERRFAADPLPDPDRDLARYLRRNLDGISIRIEDELVHAELAGASRNAIAEALLTVPGARDIASRLVSTGLIDGLGMTFEENADLVRCWEYTAIMDAATCVVCRGHDGLKFQTLEELFVVLPQFGPNPRCLGGGRCRCRAVPCHVDEAGQNPPPPPDAEPGDPAWLTELRALQRRDFLTTAGAKTEGELLTRGIVEMRKGPVDDFGFGTSEMIPGQAVIDDEAAVLRAGELLDTELEARIGAARGRLVVEKDSIDAELEPLRAEHKAREEVYRAAIKRANDAESELLARIRERITVERPDLENWEVYRLARHDPEFVEHVEAAKQRLLELMRAKSEPLEKITEARRRQKVIEEQIQIAEREGLLDLLSEVREMGRGDLDGWSYATAGRRSKAKIILDKATDFFPRSWVERGRELRLEATWRNSARAHYSRGQILVSDSSRSKVSADPDGLAVAIHELGHHLEEVDPRIKLLEWAFYHRRTRGPGYGAQESETRWPSGLGYGRHETYRADQFTEKYMGKTYGNRPTSDYELLTMGLEGVWTGDYELDREMRRFILGLLAVL